MIRIKVDGWKFEKLWSCYCDFTIAIVDLVTLDEPEPRLIIIKTQNEIGTRM